MSLMFNPRYELPVRLLLRCLPEIARHRCFALKGGTAINLFVQDLPRASVDIDLVYLPLQPRDKALQGIHDALISISESIMGRVSGANIRESRTQNYVTKLFVNAGNAMIKVEPNLVFRGSIHPPIERDLCQHAQENFELFTSAQTLAVSELYGSKLCAALDRQHPRDLFDVKLLLESTGITPDIRRAFVVYLAGHSRPMHELLVPNLHDIGDQYEKRFRGMSRFEVSLDDLREVQTGLARLLVKSLDRDERGFLLSLKRGEPEWGLLGIDHIDRLPALQWKLINIHKMNTEKRKAAFNRLAEVLQE
jgi:predicted nucleotidyltransferase component of viral defense system